ncbi:MAG TPA: hypothetical protein DET40_15590 [Lentisphaeria bacterium]|nr:hypothetical protein [Lentisphaeria bacterium]
MPEGGVGDIAFFELGDELSQKPAFNLDESVEAAETGSKVYAFGISQASKGINMAQGRISGFSPGAVALSMRPRKNEDVSGSPVVYDKTGNVLGLVKSVSENEYAGIRLDKIEKLVEVNEAEYSAEALRLHQLEDNLAAYSQKVTALPKLIKDAMDKIRKDKNLAGADKNAVLNTYENLSRESGADFQAIKEKAGKSKNPFINSKYAVLLRTAAEINDAVEEKRKDVLDMDRKFGEYFEKQKLREVNKIK